MVGCFRLCLVNFRQRTFEAWWRKWLCLEESLSTLLTIVYCEQGRNRTTSAFPVRYNIYCVYKGTTQATEFYTRQALIARS